MPRQKPIPVPKRKKAEANGTAAVASTEAAPDLSMIAENLRPLAVPISELCFDPANARKHGEGSISAIAASLRVYGQVKPVVMRSDNNVVIAGNGTLQAALSLNWTHLAAVRVAWDGATAAGFSISDNRTAELSEWDKEALDLLLREVSTANDPRLDELMAELAAEMKIVPPEDGQDTNVPELEWPEISETKTHTLTLRYSDEDETILKEFVGQETPGPLDPQRGGMYLLERIKEIVATGTNTEADGQQVA